MWNIFIGIILGCFGAIAIAITLFIFIILIGTAIKQVTGGRNGTSKPK